MHRSTIILFSPDQGLLNQQSRWFKKNFPGFLPLPAHDLTELKDRLQQNPQGIVLWQENDRFAFPPAPEMRAMLARSASLVIFYRTTESVQKRNHGSEGFAVLELATRGELQALFQLLSGQPVKGANQLASGSAPAKGTSILSRIRLGWFRCTQQGDLLQASPVFQQMFVLPGSAGRSTKVFALFQWDHARWQNFVQRIRPSQPITSSSLILEHPGNGRMQLHVVLSAASEEEYLGIVLDLTETWRVKQALRESETRYRSLVELSPDAIGVHCEGRIVFANEAAARLLGAPSKEALLGLPVMRIVHPDSVETVRQRLRKLLEKNEPVPLVEEKFVRLDGQTVSVEVAATPLEWEGKPAVQVVVRDISLRKETERALRSIAEYRKRLLSISQALLRTFDLRKAPEVLVEHLNELVPFTRLGIYLRKEGQPFLDLFYAWANPPAQPEDVPPVPLEGSLLGKSALTGKAILINHAEKHPESFYPAHNKLALEHLMCLPLKTSEGILGTIGLQRTNEPPFSGEEFEAAQIITNMFAQALHNARLFEQIRRSEKKYRTLFEESLDGIFISTAEGELLDINPAGLAILGYQNKRELVGQNMAAKIYVDPAQREGWLKELAARDYVRDYELDFRRADGKTITVQASATAVKDEQNRVVAIRGIFRDVTEQKMLAEQLRQAQKMESLGTLAGGIAHDFNNILGIILGYTSLLEQPHISQEKIALSLDAIKQAVHRGTELVNQILTFARKSDSVFEAVDINNVIRDVLKLVQGTFPSNIEIEASLREKVPMIKGDRGQLHQALLNLCLNARDAMPGGGKLILRTDVAAPDNVSASREGVTEGRYLVIEVADTGTGIDEETLGRIFEPFFTTKDRARGTGLGLAVVYGIVKSHGGTIRVWSKPGEGTRFLLYFPETSERMDNISTAEPSPTTGKGETILVAEDEELLRELLKDVLASQGYQVLFATSGLEAVELFSSNLSRIDLVLLDVGLPGKSGWEAFLEMQRLDPNIRGVLASGMLEPELRNRLDYMPNLVFIPKPYNPAELLEVIQEQLARRKAGKEPTAKEQKVPSRKLSR